MLNFLFYNMKHKRKYSKMELHLSCTTEGEQSCFTQTTPEPTLLSWGGWPREPPPPPPTVYCTYQATQTPLCSRFHWILKVILEMAFSAHCSKIWKLNQISMTIISKFAWKCIWCCHRVQQCVVVSYSEEIVQWGLKTWSRKQRWHVLSMKQLIWGYTWTAHKWF